MVSRGLAGDLPSALSLINAGLVLVNGAIAQVADHQVAPSDALVVIVKDKFVSRGGDKLDHAMQSLGINVEGRTALDAGASTGGFTDCLLQRGARMVVAVDVGKSQLHERIARNPKVRIFDETNVRDLSHGQNGNAAINAITLIGPFDIVVADLSFISLRAVAGALVSQLSVDGDLIVLVKPQFEATKLEVDKGAGIIRETAIHERVLGEVGEAFAEAGWNRLATVASPLKGAHGNTEFLVHFVYGQRHAAPND
jgi:23S rRNA (cytidine1920-2'-O)/16S rRNA (cytidine1409-2'-O)-methyltransferase